MTTADSADAVNEPCFGYYEDAKKYCPRYVVCCLKVGTCVPLGGVVSSNAKYYMGGCVSPNSRAGALPSDCAKQGECHAGYLYHMKNGTSAAGVADPVPAAAAFALMAGARENHLGGSGCGGTGTLVPVTDAYGSTGITVARFASARLILMTVVAAVVVLVGAYAIRNAIFMMRKKGAPTKQAGASEVAVDASRDQSAERGEHAGREAAGKPEDLGGGEQGAREACGAVDGARARKTILGR